MDYTKCKEFIAFSHVTDKHRYWIDGGWLYSDDCPGLFQYHTPEDKKIVKDVYNSYVNNWKLKDVEASIFKFDKMITIKIDKIIEDNNELLPLPPKKTRKKRNETKPDIESEIASD